jgi:hypothetical protein
MVANGKGYIRAADKHVCRPAPLWTEHLGPAAALAAPPTLLSSCPLFAVPAKEESTLLLLLLLVSVYTTEKLYHAAKIMFLRGAAN